MKRRVRSTTTTTRLDGHVICSAHAVALSPTVSGVMSAFEELGVSPELIRACDGLGWTLPTPVQAEAVPLILGGGDVMVGASSLLRARQASQQ